MRIECSSPEFREEGCVHCVGEETAWRSASTPHMPHGAILWSWTLLCVSLNRLSASEEQSHSRDANSHQTVRELVWLLLKFKIHCHVHKSTNKIPFPPAAFARALVILWSGTAVSLDDQCTKAALCKRRAVFWIAVPHSHVVLRSRAGLQLWKI
jgi:hypothetical protein